MTLFLFLGMGVGAHAFVMRLIRPRHRVVAYTAGTLYTINPFTYERLMAGHVLLLAAYAALPLALLAADRFLADPGRKTALALTAWTVVIAWTSLHVLWMLAPLYAVMLGVRAARGGVPWRRLTGWAAAATGAFAALNAWWIAGLFAATPGTKVTTLDLAAYATQPPGHASLGNVLGLYGFWRHEFRLPKDGVELWWLVLVPVGIAVVIGIVAGLRDPRLRTTTATLAIMLPVAAVLAAGVSFPPTKDLFVWLYEHVPGFKIFREPQKWVALIALAYAFLGAAGLDRILGREPIRKRPTALAVSVAALLIPLVATWTLVWNWDGLKPVRFPKDWAAADTVMKRDPGRALFLPWHLYMTLSFTGTRVVNPAPHYFSVPVLSGDNVELPGIPTQSTNPESAAIERVLFFPGGRERLAHELERLCIRWLMLAREADHQSYLWLERAPGLTKAYQGPTLTLWRTATAPGCRRA